MEINEQLTNSWPRAQLSHAGESRLAFLFFRVRFTKLRANTARNVFAEGPWCVNSFLTRELKVNSRVHSSQYNWFNNIIKSISQKGAFEKQFFIQNIEIQTSYDVHETVDTGISIVKFLTLKLRSTIWKRRKQLKSLVNYLNGEIYFRCLLLVHTYCLDSSVIEKKVFSETENCGQAAFYLRWRSIFIFLGKQNTGRGVERIYESC